MRYILELLSTPPSTKTGFRVVVCDFLIFGDPLFVFLFEIERK
jgi:hypothetical protein